MNKKKRRSRLLIFPAYYTILQKEFLVAYLRFCINTEYIYKKKFIDICQYKKNEILRLAFRNKYITIFDKLNIWNRYVNEIVGNGYGLPEFTYTDAIQRNRLYQWDAYYYFIKYSRVKIGNKKGIVYSNDIENKKLTIYIETRIKEYMYEDVKGMAAQYFDMDNETLKQMKGNNLSQLCLDK